MFEIVYALIECCLNRSIKMPSHRTEFICLNGRHSQIILECVESGAPVWRHWGEAGVHPLPDASLSSQRPVPPFSLDEPVPLTLVPTFGTGWFGPSAFHLHRDGKDWAHAFTACHVHQLSPDHVRIDLIDDIAKIDVSVWLRLDPDDDVLTMKTRIVNRGEAKCDIGWLAAGTLPLPPEAVSVQSLSGRYGNECLPEQDRLGRAGWRRENRRGLTSHDILPVASVTGPTTDFSNGPVWSAQLAWSGNHVQTIDWNDGAGWVWQAGEGLAPGELQLEPGASADSPEWLATFSPHGLNGAAQNFHSALRKRSPGRPDHKPAAPRLVHYNTWEGLYFDHDEDTLAGLIGKAADLGVERFVLDDGWFRARNGDNVGLGDWVADPTKYPSGLGPIADKIIAAGMAFGLWVEPEMVNPDSELYRAHPDWALNLAGRDRPTARNQLVLDMTRQDVIDYLFERLNNLLGTLPLSYLKWDHNRELTHAGAFERPAFRRQVHGTYQLIDRLRAAHPHVEIESCAAGGGRIDAGMLTRADRVWPSDNLDALSRLEMQSQFLQFFPPEIMGAHIGTAPAHVTGRSQSLAFRAGVAMFGHLGIELDLRSLASDQAAELKSWINFYKSIRTHLHAGQIWRGHAPDNVVWQASAGDDGILLAIYRTRPGEARIAPVVRLPFVQADMTYRVVHIHPEATAGKAVNENEDGRHPAVWPDRPSRDAGWREYRGAVLSGHGLALPLLPAETCLFFRLVPVGS